MGEPQLFFSTEMMAHPLKLKAQMMARELAKGFGTGFLVL